MKRFLQSGIVVCAGVLGMASAAAQVDQHDLTKNRRKFDLREGVLRKFFSRNHAPAEEYAPVFLAEADAHRLDWRLLPSLSMLESGGGKHAPGYNLFGWANGTRAFGSISEAIHLVASALDLGKSYRGKTLDGKLLAYNHRLEYRDMVTSMMRQIAAD